MPYWNTQDQQKLKWPQTFVLARAYLDQLRADASGLPADRIASARSTLASAERRSGDDRKARAHAAGLAAERRCRIVERRSRR